MRFSTLVPVVALVPALATAQTESRPTAAGAPQATSVGVRSTAAPSHLAAEPATPADAGRVLVLLVAVAREFWKQSPANAFCRLDGASPLDAWRFAGFNA